MSPRFGARQRDIYGSSCRPTWRRVGALRPGIPFRDVHLPACRTLVEGLKALGLMKGDPDEAVAEGAHALFFQCGLGHLMGLDVHDMEDLGERWAATRARRRAPSSA